MESNYAIVELQFNAAEQPKYTEKKGTGMVLYGEKNNYPNYLNRLYRESPKHGGIIKGKTTYIFGKGLSDSATLPPIKNDTWNSILRKCINDDEKYGGYYLQIIWNPLGKIASLSHIKFHKVRTNQENAKFWVKDEWDTVKLLTKRDKEKEREYNGFDPSDKTGSQILFVKQDGDENDVYPLPSYFQALNYLDADVHLSRHILGMAQSGFVASKLINFNNGEPQKEEKKEIEKRVEKKFTGSEGQRFMLSFNKNAESAVTVTDLGTSQLSKEDFTNVNLLIQQEIYAAHGITSPMLFGIKTEGQLGGRSELRDAYEIFKNTYVNERQQAHEEVFNALIVHAGGIGERKIVPVEPIGIEITEATLNGLGLPKKYFLDKLGISEADYPELAAMTAPAAIVAGETAMVNDHLKNLSAKQFQALQRTVREFNKGKLTWQAAALLLKNSYGLTDADVITFLGDENEQQQFSTEDLLPYFSEVGIESEKFVVIKKMPFEKQNDYTKECFVAAQEISKEEASVLDLISKDKRITPEVIAGITKLKVSTVARILKDLNEQGYLRPNEVIVGKDKIIERTLTKPLKEITEEKATTTSILVRYSYEGPEDDRNRPFCAKLMQLDRLYSRTDIEQISERVGYSVWDRKGGWWTMPNGEHSPSCRHNWFANIVLKKS